MCTRHFFANYFKFRVLLKIPIKMCALKKSSLINKIKCRLSLLISFNPNYSKFKNPAILLLLFLCLSTSLNSCLNQLVYKAEGISCQLFSIISIKYKKKITKQYIKKITKTSLSYRYCFDMKICKLTSN